MSTLGALLYYLLWLFLLFLIFRLVMEYVFMLSRTYRPTGFMAMALEVTYSITDPPLRALRRVLPPLRIGSVSIDLAFFVLFIGVGILQRVVVTVF